MLALHEHAMGNIAWRLFGAGGAGFSFAQILTAHPKA